MTRGFLFSQGWKNIFAGPIVNRQNGPEQGSQEGNSGSISAKITILSD
jgi:hypothetical protein